MESNKQLRIIISGGGTGGHVFPAIAIANALKKQLSEVDLLFVGAKGKLEMEKVPQAGYPIKGLWISGFHRKLTLRNLLFPIKLLSSLWKAWRIIRKFRPDVVVGVGGYASGPTLEIASRMGIPCLIQEQNSYAGVTNRILAKKVQTICVAYGQMERFFPAERLVFTGNPVRQDIWNIKNARNEAFKHYDFNHNKKIIMIAGGSLGAKSLNHAMRDNFELLRANPEVQVLWQAGRLYIKEFGACSTAQLPNVRIVDFIDRMDLAYALADVLICRAGALTVSELCAVGKPAILVPSPNVAEDHQTMNAKALADQRAALLIKDEDAGEQMVKKALSLLDDEEMQRELGSNILKLAKPNAAEDIAAEIIKLVKQ